MTSHPTEGGGDMALPPAEDRAVVNGAASVSALRASVPSADIWAYAARLDKALCELLPKDILMEVGGDELRIECTITTLIEAEAVRATIRHLSKKMTSHRAMIREDILPPLVVPTFREKLHAMFGDPAQAIEARRAETGTGSVHESAVPQGCANTPPERPQP